MAGLVSDVSLLYNLALLPGGVTLGQCSVDDDSADNVGACDMTSIDTANDNIQTTQASAGNAFQREAAERIHSVRGTVTEMLESTGQQIIKSRDAQKHFGFDVNLSWQLFKLLSGGDMLAIAQYIPKPPSMERVFSAARKKRIPETLIRTAEDAFAQYESFVETHAGDRARFESMVSSLANGEDAHQADIQQRKSLFKAHTHFLGIELDTLYIANLVGQSPLEPAEVESVFVSNMLGFNRLRPNADTFLSGVWFKNAGIDVPDHEPLDAEAFKTHGAHILPQFSTAALPYLRFEQDEFGRNQTRLVGDAVGLTSSVDLAFGEIMHGVKKNLMGGDRFVVAGRAVIIRPTRRLYMDILVDRRVFPAMQSSVELFAHATLETPPDRLEKNAWLLPSREQVQYLRSTEDARLPEVPRRRELLALCCKRQGWKIEDFDLYRLHIDYPMMDTLAVMQLVAATSAVK